MASETLMFNIFARDNASGAFRELARSVDNAHDRMARLDKELAAQGRGRGVGGGPGVAAALIASSLPILAVATGATIGLGAAFAAAGVGAVAFGAVAVPAFKAITKASTELGAAQKRVDDALTPKERLTALARQKQLIADYSPVTLKAVAAFDQFHDSMVQLQRAFAMPMMGIFTTMLKTGTAAMAAFKPLIASVFPYIQQLANSLQSSVPFWGAWANSMRSYAGPALVQIGMSIGNVIKGIGSLVLAFAPFGLKIGGSLQEMSAKFATWAANFGPSGGLAKFLDYMHTNGPIVTHFLQELGLAVGNLGGSLAKAGPGFLNVASSVLSLVNGLYKANPALADFAVKAFAAGIVIAKVAGAFKLFTIISSLPGIVGGASTAIRTLGFNMQVAGNLAGGKTGGFLGSLGKVTSFIGASGPWGLAIAAAAAVVGGIFVARHIAAKKAVDNLTTSLDKESGAISRATERQIGMALQASGAATAGLALGISLRDQILAAEGNAAAIGRVQKAMHDAKAAAGGFGDSLKRDEAVLGPVQKNIDKVTGALGTQTGALGKAKKAWSDQKIKTDQLNEALLATVPKARNTQVVFAHLGVQGIITAGSVSQLSHGLDRIKPVYRTQIIADTAAAKASVQAYINLISRVATSVHTRMDASGGIAGRAHGGSVRAGQPYIVGENRAELFVPDVNGTVVSSVPRGGTVENNFYISGALDPVAVAQQVQQILLKLKRSNGGSALGLA